MIKAAMWPPVLIEACEIIPTTIAKLFGPEFSEILSNYARILNTAPTVKTGARIAGGVGDLREK